MITISCSLLCSLGISAQCRFSAAIFDRSKNNLLSRALTSTSSSTNLVADGNSWLLRKHRHFILKRSCIIYTQESSIFAPHNKITFQHNIPIRLLSGASIEVKRSAMAQIISGKQVSEEIRERLKEKVAKLTFKPKLAIVQVGGREDSNVYIRMKIQFAESIGAIAEHYKLGKDVTEDELIRKIRELNQDNSVHGIITQLPFDTTSKIDSDKVVNMIDPLKDVDGLSIYNAGKLSHGELDSSSFIPCTPNGCMELIKKSGITVSGSRSVVIGRSKIVGSPMAQLLLWNDSTVTICHSRTKNLEEICRQADILVAAVGRAQMVKKSWLKPGAIVIDCGINAIPDSTKKSGSRLVGDVDYEECKEVAGAITPVPGGVGPMTVAMLIANTVESACRVSNMS